MEVKDMLESIKQETKQTHTQLMEAVTDFKAMDKRMDEAEKKMGVIPADLQETMAKINTSVDGLDTKHNKLIEDIDGLQTKLNDIEEAGAGSQDAETKLADEHMVEYKSYMRRGIHANGGADETKLTDFQKKSMYAGSDPDGGFVVPRPMSNMIQTAKRDATPFRQYASSTTVSGDMFRYLIDIGEAGGGWVTERGARGQTDTTQLQEGNILVHEMYAGPALTQTILDDAAFPIENWLGMKVADKFADLEANAFLLGDGAGKPRGMLTYDNGTSWGQIEQVVSGGATTITADALFTLQDSLKEIYAGNAKFYMNRRTVSAIRKFKDSANQYLWQPGLKDGEPSTLLGDPLVKMNYMPTVAANALAMTYGDLAKAYLIVDRFATRILRDPYTSTPYVIFKTNARVGGDVVNFEAMKIMKVAAS